MRPPLQITTVHWRPKARLPQMYHQTDCVRTRIRAQMVRLSLNGYAVSEIARITQPSDDTVRRWLHRFSAAGCAGLLEELHPGRPAELTPAIENFVLDCLKRSPRACDIQRARWTTATLAAVVQTKFAVEVSDECVRQHLQHLDMVCRRPPWTVKHLAKEQPGYAQKKGL